MATLPREVRDTLFLLVVIAWVIAPQTAHLPAWASAMAAGLLLWRGWLAWNGRRLPGRWVMAALLVVVVLGTLFTHRTIVGRDAGVTLIVMLLSLKTLEMRARRDALVVFFLGFFTMLSNFFFSQSLLTALAMLVALLGLLTALVNAHMPVGRPPLLQSMKMAGRMALLGAPITAALFMLFPRMAPLWGMPSEGLTARSGLSGEMRVGSMASMVLNEAVALRVKWLTPDEQPPAQRDLYFRGPVLSSFDGREWRRLGTQIGTEWVESTQAPPQLQPQGSAIPYEITLEPHRQPWLLTLDVAPERPELPPGTRAFMSPELLWLASRPVTDVTRYRAESHTRFVYGAELSPRQLRAYTELPAGFNPRTLALAQSLRSDPAIAPNPNADNTRALINAALQRLRTGGYTYTLDPGVYGEHTADEFWFDRKEGFCEHIASAFAVLMRGMDIPARIVTGYQGGDRNPVDGYWTIRQSDAHAWTEVWIAGEGWVRLDPTGLIAPNRIGAFERLQAPRGVFAEAIGTLSPGMLQQMRAVWEAVNNGWNQWILNYTQTRQLDLLKSLGFESPSWQDLGKLLGGLIAFVALCGTAWMAWERSRHDPWLRLLESARKRLQKLGLALPTHLPPRAMAQQVRAQCGPLGEAVALWLLQLEQQRYAPQTAITLNTLRREFRALAWPPAVAPTATGPGTPSGPTHHASSSAP
jgi:transglutaminase-like putative cysteine protease